MSATDDRRRQVLAWRRGLDPAVVAERSAAVSGRLPTVDRLDTALVIASFAAVDGELDPEGFVAGRRRHGVIALPVLDGRRLRFVVDRTPADRRPNRFGIDEPPGSSPVVELDDLEVVLVPLVLFDSQGHRVGHGQGFYDRTLEPLAGRSRDDRALLVGVAHDEQEVESIAPEPWDVDLDVVITPTRVIVAP